MAPPDWKPVLQLAPQILATQAKDLEIASIYLEAVVRRFGFAGLRDGFRLMREYCERFWDQLYPMPDSEGIRDRVYPISGLNGEGSDGVLVGPVMRVPITAGGGSGAYSSLEYRQALELEAIPDAAKRETRMKQLGGIPLAVFQKSVADTPVAFFRDLSEDISQCWDEFFRLYQLLDEKCGPDAPPSSTIREAIQSARSDLEQIAGDKLRAAQPEEAVMAEGDSSGDGASAAPTRDAVSVPEAIRNREDALRALIRVAEYFKKAEPHTPIPYALEQTVRWARMPLPDLLLELVPDKNAREQMFKLIGIAPPPK